jgi:ribosomal subunit interface protein
LDNNEWEAFMQILLTTDNHIEGSAKLTSYVESLVQDSLAQFNGRITRVEVHLVDQNSHKSGSSDKRCAMEARVGGLAPVNVTADAATVDRALDGAVDKLEKALRKTFDKLGDKKGRASHAGEEFSGEEI